MNITSCFPSDAATGVPLKTEIVLVFDEPVDEESAKENILLFGPDFDKAYGPWSVQWLQKRDDPYFLKSPGFKGQVELSYTFQLLDDDDNIVTDPDFSNDAPNYHSKIIMKGNLAPLTDYELYVVGNPEGTAVYGLSKRTIFDGQPDEANNGTGQIQTKGTFTGDSEKTIVIEITKEGSPAELEYIWYYQSSPSLFKQGFGSRKYRQLADGISFKFLGTDFQLADKFYINVAPKTYLEETYKVSFKTGTGSISAIPDNASTSVLGDLNSPVRNEFKVLSTSPKDQSIKVSDKLKMITVRFNNDINPSSVNDHLINIKLEPATGYDPNVELPELAGKFLYTKDNTLYILLQKGVGYE